MQILTGQSLAAIAEELFDALDKLREFLLQNILEESGEDRGVWQALAKVAVECVSPVKRRFTAQDLCDAIKNVMPGDVQSIQLLDEQMCFSCLMYPRVKKLSVCSEVGNKDTSCCFFCKRCLTNKDENPLFCPKHQSPCVEPIGNIRWFVLAICGTDADPEQAGFFKRDIIRFCNTLKNSQICGIREENVVQIVSAKSCDVLSGLETIIAKMGNQPAQQIRQRLFVSYSGHASKKGELVLNKNSNDMLSPQNIGEKLKSIDHADIVIFLDCCRAGKLNCVPSDMPEESTTSFFQIAACSQWQTALGGSRDNTHSEFTEAVLNCLTGLKTPCQKQANTCDVCAKVKKDATEQGFIDLAIMKRHLSHALPDSMWPKFKGDEFGQIIPIVYFDENVELIVQFEDSVDKGDIVEKEVHLRPGTLDECSDIRHFIERVIEGYENEYKELPGNYGKAEYYLAYKRETCAKDMQEVEEWYGLCGKVTIKFNSIVVHFEDSMDDADKVVKDLHLPYRLLDECTGIHQFIERVINGYENEYKRLPGDHGQAECYKVFKTDQTCAEDMQEVKECYDACNKVTIKFSGIKQPEDDGSEPPTSQFESVRIAE